MPPMWTRGKMNPSWVVEHLKALDPYVEAQYVYDTGMISGLKRLSQLAREIGWAQAVEHVEAQRVMNWIYENAKDPS